jgi:hypothetical protein
MISMQRVTVRPITVTLPHCTDAEDRLHAVVKVFVAGKGVRVTGASARQEHGEDIAAQDVHRNSTTAVASHDELTFEFTASDTTSCLQFLLLVALNDYVNKTVGMRVAGHGRLFLEAAVCGEHTVSLAVTDRTHHDSNYVKGILRIHIVENTLSRTTMHLLKEQADAQTACYTRLQGNFPDSDRRITLFPAPSQIVSIPGAPVPTWVYVGQVPSLPTIEQEMPQLVEKYERRLAAFCRLYLGTKTVPPLAAVVEALSWTQRSSLVAHIAAHSARQGTYVADLTYSNSDRQDHGRLISEIESCPKAVAGSEDCDGLSQFTMQELYVMSRLSERQCSEALALLVRHLRDAVRPLYCRGSAFCVPGRSVCHIFPILFHPSWLDPRGGGPRDPSYVPVYAESTVWMPTTAQPAAENPFNATPDHGTACAVVGKYSFCAIPLSTFYEYVVCGTPNYRSSGSAGSLHYMFRPTDSSSSSNSSSSSPSVYGVTAGNLAAGDFELESCLPVDKAAIQSAEDYVYSIVEPLRAL